MKNRYIGNYSTHHLSSSRLDLADRRLTTLQAALERRVLLNQHCYRDPFLQYPYRNQYTIDTTVTHLYSIPAYNQYYRTSIRFMDQYCYRNLP